MQLVPPDPSLSDGVVLLRLLRDSDVAPMVAHCRDSAMQQFTSVPSPYTDGDARTWIMESHARWTSGEAATFAIAAAGDDAYLGGIDLRSSPWPVGEIGYGLRADVRGRGITTRALRLLARWGLELGLVRLQLCTDPTNIASQRVAEKAGFMREGVLRQALEVKGRRSDCVMFSLLPGDAAARCSVLGRAIPLWVWALPASLPRTTRRTPAAGVHSETSSKVSLTTSAALPRTRPLRSLPRASFA